MNKVISQLERIGNSAPPKTWISINLIVMLVTTIAYATGHEWIAIGAYFSGAIMGATIVLQLFRLHSGK